MSRATTRRSRKRAKRRNSQSPERSSRRPRTRRYGAGKSPAPAGPSSGTGRSSTSLNTLPEDLVTHIASFLSDDRTCSRRSRNTLISEVKTTCSAIANPEVRTQCSKKALEKHSQQCRRCTIKVSEPVIRTRGKKLYFQFDMKIGFPPEQEHFERYVKYLTNFCLRLNEKILYEVADNKSGDAFSPEEYQSTGEELGMARGLPQDYYYPSIITALKWRRIDDFLLRLTHRRQLHEPLLAERLESGTTEFNIGELHEMDVRYGLRLEDFIITSSNRYFEPVPTPHVRFSCLLYLTREKKDFSEFGKDKLELLNERERRTTEKLKTQYKMETIMKDLGDYLVWVLSNELDDVSSSITENYLRVRGFG